MSHLNIKILTTFQESRKEIVCNVILGGLLIGPLKRLPSDYLKRFIATAILFVFSGSVVFLCFLIAGRPSRLSTSIAIVSALIGSLSFYLISWNYDYIVRQVKDALPGADAIGNTLDESLSNWIKKAVNRRLQLLGSVISLTFIALILYLIVDVQRLTAEHFGKSIALFIVIFAMGQGAYWALVSPLFTRELSKANISDLRVHPIYPSRTPILISASRFLSVASLSDALMVTLCLIGLFVIRPRFSSGLIYPLIIVLSGYLLTTWNFLLPQLNLARIIQRAKKNTLDQIGLEVRKLHSNFNKLSSAEFELLEHQMKLHDAVSKEPNTMINFVASRSLVGSLLIPTLVAIIGALDWNRVLQKLPTTFR